MPGALVAVQGFGYYPDFATFRTAPPMRTVPDSVCILRLSAIGDTCHTLAVVRTLMRAWPETRFTWIIGRVEATLLGDIPGLEFITYDKSLGRAADRQLRHKLAGRRFDVLLHMQASMRANLASRAIRAPIRLGFDRKRARDFQWLFTNKRIAARPREHVLDGLMGFANALGVASPSREQLTWDIPLSADDEDFARGVIPDGTPALVISPCSSQRARNYRNWPVAHYASIADHAARRWGAQVVVTGGPTELEHSYGRQIAARTETEPMNLVGTTSLKQLLAVLARATVLVCPDSGPAHMATTVGTPVVGLYATSNPARTGPVLSARWVVDRYGMAIEAEFGKTVDKVRWGKRVRNPDAMSLIQVADVTSRLDALFDSA